MKQASICPEPNQDPRLSGSRSNPNARSFGFKMKSMFLVVIFGGLMHAGLAQTPVDRHGALQVIDGKIVDARGEAPRLRGISFSWSLWDGQKYYNTDVADWICADFKASLIRVSMGVEPGGGYLEQPEFQKQLVTTVIDQALKNGVYVLIDWHDHHAEKHVEAAKVFFAEMAQKYAGNPQIIYEIFNEPDYQSWQVVKDYSIQIIQTIRAFDPKNLIVVGCPHWDQDVDVVANDPIAGFENLCYSFHFYASDNNHQEQLRRRADAALAQKLPLFVTEWGVGEANGNGIFDLNRTETWVNWMEKNQLSWVCWNITDKAETTAFLKPGANATANWTAAELTPNGVYIRELLRKLNP